jgi:DNA invertase Pin-like site-specific DNA recombinase
MTRATRKKTAAKSAPAKGQLIGYARVSKNDQSTDLQMDALEALGCDQIYVEKESRVLTSNERPELTNALRAVRAGDTLVVWKLDRLGGNLADLIATVDGLGERNVDFRSLTENIDTSTATGRMFFQVVGAFAEFERNRLVERTKAGIAAARARGRIGGRPPALTPKQIQKARAMLTDPEITVTEVCEHFGVSRSTLYKRVGAVRPERKGTGKGG